MNLRDFHPLRDKGLVKIKEYPEKNLAVVKYDRSVFYKNKWGEDPLLMEARGHVFDMKTGKQIVFPPTKVFNYLENNAGTDLSDDQELCAVRKVNGFLTCVTWINGEMIASTTGSLDSSFVELARKHVEGLDWEFVHSLPFYRYNHMTFHFEIVDESDPHIVEEIPGAYLIGCKLEDGREAHEHQLDDIAYDLGAMRPEWCYTYLSDLKKLIKEVKHEGFMVKDAANNEKTLFKWKSPHYLTKKFLMRMGAVKVDNMYRNAELFRQSLDEEFYDVFDHIIAGYSQENWTALSDQERRDVIEGYFNG